MVKVFQTGNLNAEPTETNCIVALTIPPICNIHDANKNIAKEELSKEAPSQNPKIAHFDDDSSFSSEDEELEVENGELSKDIPTKTKVNLRKYYGLILAIVSSFIFTLSALLVKKMDQFDPLTLAMYKFQGAFVPGIPLLLQKRYCSQKGPAVIQSVWPLTDSKKLKMLGLVLLRSFLAVNALLLHFFSLKYIPMADALTIGSASPIFVTLFAKLFLNEKCGWSTIIASLCSILGVVAIAKPPLLLSYTTETNQNILIGTTLAFCCTIVTAISFIVLRSIRRVHYSVTTLAYGAFGSLEMLLLLTALPSCVKYPTSLKECLECSALAMLTLFGQLTIILAMKCEQAGPVALVRTCDVLFAFLFEISVLNTLPDKWSLIGGSVIVLSVSFVALRKWVRSFGKDHVVRKRLWFISMS